MKFVKLLISAIPYGFVVLFAFWQAKQPPAGYFNSLAMSAPRSPNQITGEVWEVTFRGGGLRYVTQSDFVLFWAPFVVVPVFIVATVWIIHDWYKAGVFEMFSSR